jgi:hypothetical protein
MHDVADPIQRQKPERASKSCSTLVDPEIATFRAFLSGPLCHIAASAAFRNG